MLKRLFLTTIATLLFAFQFNISTANAAELSEEIRTVNLNDQVEKIVLTLKQVKQGHNVFVDKCSYCH